MRTLTKLKIEGFKSIANQELQLTDLNVLIGANGSGKSNLIGVFRLLDRVLSKNLQKYVGEQGGADRFLHHGRKVTPHIEIDFRFKQNAYGFRLKPAVGDTLVFETERVEYHGYWDWSEPIAVGHKESYLEEAAKSYGNKIPRYVFPEVKNWVVYHFHDTSDSAPPKGIADLDDNRFFRPDGGNLAPFLYSMHLQNETAYRHVVEHVRLVAPFFSDFVTEPSKNNPGKIKLEWRHKDSDAYFDAYSFSDGTLRFICLATLLLQPQLPSLILIDEPELGLHPFALKILSEMLEAAATRTQIIVATQSVTLLNNFSPEVVIVAENDGSKSTFRRLEAYAFKDWLEEYTVGDLWEKNVIGGRP